MTATTKQPLSNAQLEILQLFATNLSEEEILELRQMLIEFRARRLQLAIEQLNPTPSMLEQWGKAHDRTPYRSSPIQK